MVTTPTHSLKLEDMSGNCLTPRTRRSLFLSTYSLNSNESSIDSPLNTPPLRRHSNSLVGEPDSYDSCDSLKKNLPNYIQAPNL